MPQRGDQLARLAPERQDDVEGKVFPAMPDEGVDANDRNGSRQEPGAEVRFPRSVIPEDTGRNHIRGYRLDVREVVDRAWLVAAEAQDHFVLHAQVRSLDEEQYLGFGHVIAHATPNSGGAPPEIERAAGITDESAAAQIEDGINTSYHPEDVTGRPPQILVVEDDADVRRMFRTALALAGFDVHDVGVGFDALRRIDQARPDLIVLDLMLPDISGFVIRQEIAAQAHTRNIPIVVVTGSSLDLAGLDVACVLRKPVAPEELLAVVQSCLSAGARQAGL